MRFPRLGLIMLIAASVAEGQRFGGGRFGGCRLDAADYFISPFFAGNPLYDGRGTFARIMYQGTCECGREGPGWAHDYPRTDVHFMRIMKEITFMRPFVEKGPV